jgi:hypothetical protein
MTWARCICVAGFIALIKNEFQGLVIHCDPESAGCTQSGIRSGEDVISTMVSSDSIADVVEGAGRPCAAQCRA